MLFLVPVAVCAGLPNTPWPLIAELDDKNFDEHISVDKRCVNVQLFQTFSCERNDRTLHVPSDTLSSNFEARIAWRNLV